MDVSYIWVWEGDHIKVIWQMLGDGDPCPMFTVRARVTNLWGPEVDWGVSTLSPGLSWLHSSLPSLHSGLTSRHHITESQRSPQVDNIVLDVYLVNFKYTVTEYTFDNQTVRDWDGLNQDKI